MYVYKQTENPTQWEEDGVARWSLGLWTVGFYDPSGTWMPESDHDSAKKAASRVNYLNGGAVSFQE